MNQCVSEKTTGGYGDLKAATAELKGDEADQTAGDTAAMLGGDAILPGCSLAHGARKAGITA